MQSGTGSEPVAIMENPMKDLKLYTFKLCPFAHRVRIALTEKGLNYEQIEIDLKNKPADFTKISPLGRVPFLVHGTNKVWESAVILEYLEDAFPDAALMPEDPADRAKVRLWIDFANARLFAATHRLIFTTDEAARQQLTAEMVEGVRILEREGMRNGQGPYLLGAQFTLADVALYPWFEQVNTLEKFSTFKMPEDSIGIRKWQKAVAARPHVMSCARSDNFYAQWYQHYLAA
jgi:glutathione S-transferase